VEATLRPPPGGVKVGAGVRNQTESWTTIWIALHIRCCHLLPQFRQRYREPSRVGRVALR
jgi:hypothetical protein